MNKFLTLAVLATVATLATAGHITYDHGHGHGYEHQDYFAPANYKFNYAVKDPHTGDNKEQYETRHGDVVKGSYSVAEPDGTIRVVEYTSHPHIGFNAVVKKIGHAVHPQHYATHGHDHYGH